MLLRESLRLALAVVLCVGVVDWWEWLGLGGR